MTYLDPVTLQKLGPLNLVARQVVEGVRVGMHRSPLRGFSTDFAQHRQYVPGDELRHVDWRVFGRTSRYYVKLYEAETNFAAMLLLDASSSMAFCGRPGGVSKLEYAKFMAASLAHLIVGQRDAVGLGVFDGQIRRHIEPRSNPAVARHIAEVLETVEPNPRTDVAAVLHDVARRLPRRGFVILLSDLLDQAEAFLQAINHLRFRGHNVIVFQVLDHAELEFPYNGTVRFEGLEQDGQMLTDPKRVRATYLRELDRFLTRIRTNCQQTGTDHYLVDTSRPVDAVLSEYLIGRMRGIQ